MIIASGEAKLNKMTISDIIEGARGLAADKPASLMIYSSSASLQLV